MMYCLCLGIYFPPVFKGRVAFTLWSTLSGISPEV